MLRATPTRQPFHEASNCILQAPRSLGEGDVLLGPGFGRLRLSLLVFLCGGVVHLTLIQRVRSSKTILT
jgi:hypothetical protein